MPADLGLDDDGHAVEPVQRVGAPGEQERGDVSMQGQAGPDVAVVLDIDGVAEEGPAVAVVVFRIVTGVQQVAQPWQVFVLDGEVRRRSSSERSCGAAGRARG